MSAPGSPSHRRPGLDAVEALLARARAFAPGRRGGAVARRCAWCGRYASDGRWIEAERLPEPARVAVADAPTRVTDTICPDCFAETERRRRRRWRPRR